MVDIKQILCDMDMLKKILYIIFLLLILGCSDSTWNNPYPKNQSKEKILYSAFSERPKHLDPARSYSSNEWEIIGQIYEPPLQYHYLKRPYELTTAVAENLPSIEEKNNKIIYTIKIKPNILYAPHPAFAKSSNNQFLYHDLSHKDMRGKNTIADFKYTDTKELTADDFIYQIKRLANPKLHSPIFSLMATYIDGLHDFYQNLNVYYKEHPDISYADLRNFDLRGVKKIDKYTYQIILNHKYPQFIYWLAMPFFTSMPWEVDKFYSQELLAEKNITLDWYPVGTGPYSLIMNNPNLRMILAKNPNFHPEFYPNTGADGDIEKGLLNLANEKLPFIDKVIFNLDKESIPYWNKFLQGYYDKSGISSDSFSQAIQTGTTGNLELSDEMLAKGIKLRTSVGPTTMYYGFNMLDDVVGGLSPRAKKLRQAISIAIDVDEFIAIFLNGRGISAQSPLPPEIFGANETKEGINKSVFSWQDGALKRKSISDAKKLLAQAGYPQGRDIKTGEPLIIHYDTIVSSGPDSAAQLDWMRKQFAKIDINLDIRATQYNRFQEKMKNGNAQFYFWGWNGDYPDPENFLFLLYGPNGKVKNGGENASNYSNPEFDKLFLQMRDMENSAERKAIITKMLKILQDDAPWVFGYHPKSFALAHSWVFPSKTNEMARNTIKYLNLDQNKRNEKQKQWNKPIKLPLYILLAIVIIILIPPIVGIYRREYKA